MASLFPLFIQFILYKALEYSIITYVHGDVFGFDINIEIYVASSGFSLAT